MNTWTAQWPNSLIEDNRWHWMGDFQVNTRGPAGNVTYGPQTYLRLEVSRNAHMRNVVFAAFSGGMGEVEEKVTFQQAKTLSYSFDFSMGIRRVLGDRGRNWLQAQLKIPRTTQYVNDDFPFDSDQSIKTELLFLRNQAMPWSRSHPDFLSTLSFTLLYSKNLEHGAAIFADHQTLIHISSAIHSWHPVFLAPFVSLQSEQLLAPPSIWTSDRESRILSSIRLGLDLAIAKPVWDTVKIRLAVPIYERSTKNGFPDGTQPASSIKIALSYGGILSL